MKLKDKNVVVTFKLLIMTYPVNTSDYFIKRRVGWYKPSKLDRVH